MPARANRRVKFTAEADDDIASAYYWYEEREIGLGEEFLRAIAARISLILRHPEMFPVALDNVRRAILRRFPYEIFYEVVENDLIVHAAFACSQCRSALSTKSMMDCVLAPPMERGLAQADWAGFEIRRVHAEARQILGGQIDPPSAAILAHIAQDVRQLKCHATLFGQLQRIRRVEPEDVDRG